MQIVHDFRALHTIAELDRTLPKTLSYIEAQLSPLNCRVFAPIEGSICAYFDFNKPESLAFRADMDALPIEEKTGLPWQSQHEGVMHACGHDGHTAILLELARRLSRKQTLPHNVLLIFQPAEETTGGAEDICRTGVLQMYRVKFIFGLHLWPGLPKGQLFSRPGALMSRSCGITVRFTGRSAHIASCEKGLDALAACCEFYRQATQIQEQEPHLLRFGRLTGGTAGNVVCDRAELLGSLRTFREAVHERLTQRLSLLCGDITQKTGCKGGIQFSQGYPAVWNDEKLYFLVRKCCPVAELPEPFMTTEDFSYYQKQVPGLFFLFGIGDTPPLHSPIFTFDSEVLPTGADFFEFLCQIL